MNKHSFSTAVFMGLFFWVSGFPISVYITEKEDEKRIIILEEKNNEQISEIILNENDGYHQVDMIIHQLYESDNRIINDSAVSESLKNVLLKGKIIVKEKGKSLKVTIKYKGKKIFLDFHENDSEDCGFEYEVSSKLPLGYYGNFAPGI